MFEVYVISGDGELRRWANPLYPSEAMSVRTGEDGASFTLPEGMEFFLRQTSAPEGYVFDAETLIPVVGSEGEIIVRNAVAGELSLRAQDSLGGPIEGVELSVQLPDGSAVVLVTDENGEAALTGEGMDPVSVLVSETALPEGAYAALSATVDGVEADAVQPAAQIAPAQRTQVVFEHPASGSVQLSMSVQSVGEDGELLSRPLSGVRMDIEGNGMRSIVTDEQGQAQAALLEGTYDARFSYEGAEGIVLPLEAGQLVVRSGYTTLIELSAKEAAGRIVVQAEAAQSVSGGSVTIQSELTGESVGTFALDADGMAAAANAIAPDIESLDIDFTEGNLEIVLSGNDLSSITISCGGTLRLLLTDTDVSFRAVITPAGREFAVTQQVLSALQ